RRLAIAEDVDLERLWLQDFAGRRCGQDRRIRGPREDELPRAPCDAEVVPEHRVLVKGADGPTDRRAYDVGLAELRQEVVCRVDDLVQVSAAIDMVLQWHD